MTFSCAVFSLTNESSPLNFCRYLPSSLREESVDCWTDSFNSTDSNHGDDFLVMATAAKSGAVLSARLVAEV